VPAAIVANCYNGEQKCTDLFAVRLSHDALWSHPVWRPDNSELFFVTTQHNDIKRKAVFSFLRHLQTWHYPHVLLCAVLWIRAAAAPARQQSIDMSYLPGPQQQTYRMLLLQANGPDRWTLDIDPALHTLQAVPIIHSITKDNEVNYKM